MSHPRQIPIADYSYDLPDDRIAKYPLPERDTSKLLVYQSGAISEDTYRNIATYIPKDSLVVFNDTRVIHARLLFPKDTGAVIEIFCLEPDARYADITTAMSSRREVYWRCLVGKASKWQEPKLQLAIPAHGVTLTASIHSKDTEGFIIHLSWGTDATFAEILHWAGAVPLPPYIKRTADKADAETYQTIYSKIEGSVAAPTAGLHFTEAIFNDFRQHTIDWDFVTLHVGAGTFLPVKAALIADHTMHAEWLDVSLTLLKKIEGHLQPTHVKGITAIGTTAARTLESLYWLGLKIFINPNIALENLTVHQWDAYDIEATIDTPTAIRALISYLEKRQLSRIITKTQLLIAPSYKWRMVSCLVTNFHQPNSTLLLLVASLIGQDWKTMYDYALSHEFRFLSYGDGCILLP